MTMRKNKLLIAAAVAALTAGSGLAFAQGVPDSNPASKANPAAKNAPAEKIAPAPKAPAMNSGASELKGAPKSDDKAAQKSDDKAAPANKMGQTSPANKSKTETTGQTQREGTKSKAETTGQAPTSQGSERSKSDSTKTDTTTQSPSQPSSKTTQDKLNGQSNQPNQATSPAQRSGGSAAGTTNNTNVSVNLTPEQKTKIHQVIVSDRSAPRVASVNFQLNVGVAVPRSVRLAPVPVTLVEIQPSWRGFEYFLVGDEIVIVNPRTLEIVAVIPA
jgi:hypothetical protein